MDYDAPATLGFLMRFYAAFRGKYSFDANNLYTFTGTSTTDTICSRDQVVTFLYWDM